MHAAALNDAPNTVQDTGPDTLPATGPDPVPDDAAARAFETLTATVERQAATIAELMGVTGALSDQLKANTAANLVLAQTPALQLTPARHAAQVKDAIAAAAKDAKAHWDVPHQDAIKEWKTLFDLNATLRRRVDADRFHRWLARGALVLCLLLYPLTIAKSALGVQLATLAVGMTDPWKAGNYIMNQIHPEIVSSMVDAQALADGNAAAITACREQARPPGEPVACTIKLTRATQPR